MHSDIGLHFASSPLAVPSLHSVPIQSVSIEGVSPRAPLQPLLRQRQAHIGPHFHLI